MKPLTDIVCEESLNLWQTFAVNVAVTRWRISVVNPHKHSLIIQKSNQNEADMKYRLNELLIAGWLVVTHSDEDIDRRDSEILINNYWTDKDKASPMAVSYELGKLLSTLCLMNTQLSLAKVHSMILLSYCFSSLVACADKDERAQMVCTCTEQCERNTSVIF